MKQGLKNALIFGALLAALLIVFFISLVLKAKVEQKRAAQQSNLNNSQTANTNNPDDEIISETDTYKNSEYGFSFTFPNLDQFEGINYKISIPNGNANTNLDATVAYQHKIYASYCSPKGDCFPTTTDMLFGAAVLNENIDQYAKKNPQLVRAPITSKTYAYSYDEGVEGEGINYYFIAINPAQTVVIFHQYIDETVLPKYKDQPDFITYATQKKRMDDMLKTFEWHKGTGNKTSIYKNSELGFEFTYPSSWGDVKFTKNKISDQQNPDTKPGCKIQGYNIFIGFSNQIGAPMINANSRDINFCVENEPSFTDFDSAAVTADKVRFHDVFMNEPVIRDLIAKQATGTAKYQAIIYGNVFGGSDPQPTGFLPSPSPELKSIGITAPYSEYNFAISQIKDLIKNFKYQ